MSDDKKSISECLNVEDFKVLRHQVVMRNESSQTSVINPNKIEILQFNETTIILYMQNNTCRAGHILSLFFFKHPIKKKLFKLPDTKNSKELVIEAVGKVQSMSEPDEDGNCSFDINLTQYNEHEWSKIRRQYLEHQRKINNLIKISRS